MCNADFILLYSKRSHSLIISEKNCLRNLEIIENYFSWTLTKLTKHFSTKSLSMFGAHLMPSNRFSDVHRIIKEMLYSIPVVSKVHSTLFPIIALEYYLKGNFLLTIKSNGLPSWFLIKTGLCQEISGFGLEILHCTWR